MSNTIFPAKYYPIFQVFHVPGGWEIWKLVDAHTAIALTRVYENRDLAMARARRLNAQLAKEDTHV